MKNILRIFKTVLLLISTSLQWIEVISTQEEISYMYYQQLEYPRDCKEVLDQCSSDNYTGVYTIKPDGYPQPFEVYCNNDISSGGWTVIQRLIDGTLTLKRNWEDYGRGFGFLSREFWIGHHKLSFLTNQEVYELRIDIVLANGSSFYVIYNSFRISDEWSGYAITSAQGFRSNISCFVSTCPFTMTQENCSCQDVCTDPIRQRDCYTDCIETCVPKGCLVTQTNTYISNGEFYINEDCTQNCTCISNQLSCNAHYECSTDATCTVKDGIRKCYCKERFEGNGETCVRSSFSDCYHALQVGHTTNGVYTILPTGWKKSPFTVFCDMITDGGGWTVFQRRNDGVTGFYRDWNEYKEGFGSRDAGNDFWLGNEQIYYLTNQTRYKLRVDIVTSDGSPKYEEYAFFEIGDVSTNYRLSIGSYSESAGNGFLHHNGTQFSTRNQDNDECGDHNLAEGHKGGWWYTNNYCSDCHRTFCGNFETGRSCKGWGSYSNLNGDYNGGNGKNIFWYYYYFYYNNYCNLNSAEMKVRPSSV